MALPAYLPSPPINSCHVGPLDVHFYALAYLVGIAVAVVLTRYRWRAVGGDPELVGEIALWVVPAGIIGGRIYFDITTPMDIPHVWYGPFAVWTGGLGIWGGVALAAVVGAWRLRRPGLTVGPFGQRVRADPGTGPALRHFPAALPVRADLGPCPGRVPGLAGAPCEDQAMGPV